MTEPRRRIGWWVIALAAAAGVTVLLAGIVGPQATGHGEASLDESTWTC